MVIGSYTLDKPLTNSNAGFSRWGIGEKDGKKYFIKEFLSPVYPENNSGISNTAIEKKRKLCREFEYKEQAVINNINTYTDGNILRINEFFRCGSKYYLATDYINSIKLEEVYKLPYEEKIMLMKILAHGLYSLHAASLIHGDIKMDNILFYKLNSKFVTAKIIDVDGCYFKNEPPKNPDDIVVDQVYMAPETFIYIAKEEGKLTEMVDSFAMGIIFHQILTGKLPDISEEYDYIYECILDGKFPVLAVENEMHNLIMGMLRADSEKRMNMQEVLEVLNGAMPKSKTDLKKEEKADTAGGFFMPAGDL